MLQPQIVVSEEWFVVKIFTRDQSTLMKPEGLTGCHQTLPSQVGSGHETRNP